LTVTPVAAARESMRESSSTRLETFLPPLLWSFEPNKTNPERYLGEIASVGGLFVERLVR
jgi:hypothetical protein